MPKLLKVNAHRSYLYIGRLKTRMRWQSLAFSPYMPPIATAKYMEHFFLETFHSLLVLLQILGDNTCGFPYCPSTWSWRVVVPAWRKKLNSAPTCLEEPTDPCSEIHQATTWRSPQPEFGHGRSMPTLLPKTSFSSHIISKSWLSNSLKFFID